MRAARSERSAREAGSTIYDVFADPSERKFRRLPSLVAAATKLVWRAAPREVVIALLLQLVTGVGVATQLLLGSWLLGSLLRVGSGSLAVIEELVPGLLVLLAVTALVNFGSAARQELQRLLPELAGRYAQTEIIDVAAAVDLDTFESPEFHDRIQRAQLAAMARPYTMTMSLGTISTAVVSIAAAVVALLALEPLLVPPVLIAFVPAWIVTARNSKQSYSFGFDHTPSDRKRFYIGSILTTRPYAKEVRSLAVAPFLRSLFDSLFEDRITRLRQTIRGQLRRSLVASFVSSALLAGSVLLLAMFLLTERISVAAAAASAVAIQQVGQRLQMLWVGISGLYEGALFLEDLRSFLSWKEVLLSHEGPPSKSVPAPTVNQFSELRVEEVSFAYPGEEYRVLSNVSLRLRAGEVIALVGENGSGKTTLAKLLCQLHQPSGGRILWNGVDTSTLDQGELRRSIGVVFQDFIEYFLTARDNVSVGQCERMEDFPGIVAAAQKGGADSFLSELPEGYDSLLGKEFEGGHELSVGQWQRVALSRAFFRDAPVLILDEPTAALDPRAEQHLFRQIRHLSSGRAILFISHRFSSARAADRIYVLQKGYLVESGSHEELLERGGLYSELYSLQACGYSANGGCGGKRLCGPDCGVTSMSRDGAD